MVTVADVTAVPVEAPLEEPFGYAQGWVETRAATLVRVEASDGTIGWGECWGPIAGTREAVDDLLGPHVVGEPVEPRRLYRRLYDLGRRAYQSTVPLPAISGIEIALWDLRGKLLAEPVSALLGGARRGAVRPYATGHYFRPLDDLDAQYDAVVEEARTNADALGAVKLKVGLSLLGHGADEDVELVRRVREAVGDATVMVDANYAYDRGTARRVGRDLEALDVHWFEEPVAPEDLAGYADLRARLDVPVAGGECHAPHEFDRLLERDGLDIAQPDVCNVGGLTPASRVAARARDRGVTVVPHVWGTPVAIAASLHLIATLEGDPWLEFDRSPNPLREDLAADPIAPEGGTVAVPDGPGLGIDLDGDAVERYRAAAQ